MTLNAKDIEKINRLYGELERLHGERRLIKGAVISGLAITMQKGTSGVEYLTVRDVSGEALAEIRDVLARDIRRRAAKTVEALHKLGCEASLTED